jgi:hypothetical protein
MHEKVFLGSDACFYIDLMQGINLNKNFCNTTMAFLGDACEARQYIKWILPPQHLPTHYLPPQHLSPQHLREKSNR